MADGAGLLTEGFKLNVEQRGLLIRVGWVIFVTFHVAWVCGRLAMFGLVSPFVSANELNAVATALQSSVEQATAPTNKGLQAIIAANIAQLEEDVDVMEFRRTSAPSRWTELDARMLTRAKQRLETQRIALSAIQVKKEPGK